MPVYNGAAYLAEALRSVWIEDNRWLEIIVIDDGSTDDTPAVARQWRDRIVYRRQANAGPGAARNVGLAVAGADVIGFLDADDLWPPDKLRRQLRFLDTHPHVDAVLGTIQWLRRARGRGTFERVGVPMKGFQLGCGLYRRRMFDRVGLFDASLHPSDDVDWLLRAREAQALIAALDEVGLLYRHHEWSMTYGVPTEALGLLRVIKRSIDRRRDGAELRTLLPPVQRQGGAER